MKKFSFHRNSVLFFMPDYHSSFFARLELERLGLRVGIFVPWNFPGELLWSDDRIHRGIKWAELSLLNQGGRLPSIRRLICISVSGLYLAYLLLKYKKIYVYGSILSIGLVKGKYLPLVNLARKWGTTFYSLPSGCREEDLRSNWERYDSGNVCGNCGFSDRCNDDYNRLHFEQTRRHCAKVSTSGYLKSSELELFPFRNKFIDLTLWSQTTCQLKNTTIERSGKVRVMHQFSPQGRDYGGKNIKGSRFVIEAVQMLSDEGHEVEYYSVSNVPSNEMRFYQSTADIVVDQLIYGWYGSTTLESLALGKPVVCYLNPEFEDNFFRVFPEYVGKLPILNANPENVGEILRKLVLDEDYRTEVGLAGREFAESFLDPQKNVFELIDFLDIEKSKLRLTFSNGEPNAAIKSMR